jgi:formylmethanofuran dehydrogenase subunit D
MPASAQDLSAMALGDFLFPHAELKLVIARSFETDIEAVADKTSNEYLDIAARVQLEEGDMKRLNVKDGDVVAVESPTATVMVRAFTNNRQSNGLAVMSQSPWAMALVSVPDDDSPPRMHGISVTIKASKESVTPIKSLL